jgi:hypothetical protein
MSLEEQNIEGADEISLKKLILRIRGWYRYLLSKWVTILIFGILGGILGFFYAKFKKPVYSASTTFVLEDSDKGGLTQYAGLASIAGIDIGGGGGIFQGDNILELYKSRTMIEKTLLTEIEFQGKKKLLIDHYIDFNKLREQWAKIPKLKNIQFKGLKTSDFANSDLHFNRTQDSVLGVIANNITNVYLNVSKPDKSLSIIKAEIKAPDEFFAKEFDEQLVKNVNNFYVQTKTKKSKVNVAIMQKKTDSVRAVMNGSIYASAAIADATPNLNATHQIQRIAPLQRSQFSVESNKAMLGELVKNLELSKISLLKETPLIQVLDAPILPLDVKILSIPKGIVVGAFLTTFLTSLVLLVRRFFENISK